MPCSVACSHELQPSAFSLARHLPSGSSISFLVLRTVRICFIATQIQHRMTVQNLVLLSPHRAFCHFQHSILHLGFGQPGSIFNLNLTSFHILFALQTSATHAHSHLSVQSLSLLQNDRSFFISMRTPL